MAKIRLPDKVKLKISLLQPENFMEKRSSCTSVKMPSNINSSHTCSSSSETHHCAKFTLNSNLDDIINGVKNIKLLSKANINKINIKTNSESEADVNSNFVYTKNIVDACKGQELNKDNDIDEEELDKDLIERGPVRPQFHQVTRSRPYIESHHWPPSGLVQPAETSTDYDTSAKAILTDCEYRKKIDFCLDKLSDMTQDRSATNSRSPTHSDFSGASGFSPPQQQWQTGNSPGLVPSITIGDSESSLLEILSQGGFQPAQASKTPEHVIGAGSHAYTTDNWPDSPASSYNAYATSASRPDSRASSRAHSPGSNNGCSAVPFINVLGSPHESPQVSPQNFRLHQRPSSSSSSSQSYCDTPSPANYQNPLEHHLEEQLGDNIMSRLPIWRDSFESSDTLVNSSELQLQLVEEVIRGDMSDQVKNHKINDMQVVPISRISPPTVSNISPPVNLTVNRSGNSSENLTLNPATNHVANSIINPATSITTNSCSVVNGSHLTSSYLDNIEATDDLTNTLLKFVGGEQAMIAHKKLEVRCSSATSGYSSNSSSSNEAWKNCEANGLNVEQPIKINFLGVASSITPQQSPSQQTYQQCININGTMNPENVQFSTAAVDPITRHTWQNYSESNATTKTPPSNNHFREFQIPETITSYSSQRSKNTSKSGVKGTTGERVIAPWPSLNLPSTKASERLKEVTDPREVEKAMKNLLKKPLEHLTKADEDGDTMLMCLAGNPLELRKKLAYLVPLVERLGSIDGALSTLNSRGEDALFLAAMNCPQMAFVAGYLAAAFLQKNIDIGQRLYRSRGDTLVHALAAKGDAHGEVLAELLSLKTVQGNSVFDLSKRNYDGRTALHVATEAHDSQGQGTKTVSIATVRLLLDRGAEPTTREVRCGDTALHLAIALSCDPSLIKALLTGRGREAVNIANYNGNTALHMAAAISERTSLERQSEICWHLIHAGGRTNLTNRQGKTPLALASSERKEALRRIFHKKT